MDIEYIMRDAYTDVKGYRDRMEKPVSRRRIRKLCEQKRLSSFKVGKWFIRKDSPYPRGKDAVKNGNVE